MYIIDINSLECQSSNSSMCKSGKRICRNVALTASDAQALIGAGMWQASVLQVFLSSWSLAGLKLDLRKDTKNLVPSASFPLLLQQEAS
jgi:hypothetical protein